MVKSVQVGVVMNVDLDTLLITLYAELVDRIIPALGMRRRGPGRPPVVTDAELVCLAVAQVLLRYNEEHHWLPGLLRGQRILRGHAHTATSRFVEFDLPAMPGCSARR